MRIHKAEIIQRLADAPAQIYLTIDIWSARNRKAFNGIVAHWFANGEHYHALLALSPLYDHHRGVNIGEDVLRVLDDYHIAHKLGYINSDNVGSNDIALEVIGNALRHRGVKFNPKWRRVRCFGHILNLIARTLLFGKDPNIIEARTQILEDGEHQQEEFRAWDAVGVVGRLHNIIK